MGGDIDDQSTTKPSGGVEPNFQISLDQKAKAINLPTQQETDFIPAIDTKKSNSAADGGALTALDSATVQTKPEFRESGIERIGAGKDSGRATPWTVHVDEEINSAKIVKAKTESVLTADMRDLLSNNGTLQGGSPKVGELKTGQPQDRDAKAQGELPLARTSTVPSEIVPGKNAGITTGAANDVKVAAKMTGPEPVLKATPVDSRPAETGSEQRVGEKLDSKEVRREPASEQQSGLAPISSMPFKSEIAKPQTEVKDVSPRPAVPTQGDLLARSMVSPDKVVEVPGAVRNKPTGTSDSVKPNVDAPAAAKPALPSLNKADGGQIKSDASNLSGIKSGGSLEPAKEGIPSPPRQVLHSDALPGADAKTGHGPAVSEIGGTNVPGGRLDGGKISPPGVDGGHKTDVPAPIGGTKIPPKVADGPTEKPQTISEGPKVVPPRIGDSKVPTGQNSGEKQPVKTEGTKSPTVNPGDKSQGQSPGPKADGGKSPLANPGDKTPPPGKADGTKSPPLTPGDRTQGQTPGVKSDGIKAPMSGAGDRTQGQISGGKTDGAKTPFANPGDRTQSPGSKIPESIDGKDKISGTKAADTKSGTKSDGSGRNDSASDGRTSKITSPWTGTKGDIRTPFGERPDPRTGKEKANPQVDPGSHAETGRPVKGPRETGLGTRMPVQRGDTRVPVDPGSRSDKTGKTDIGSRGDKQGTRIGTETGGSGKSADGKTPANDAGKKQGAESEPAGSKGQSGAGTRRPEMPGTANGAASLSPEAAAAKAKGTGAKLGDGAKPSDPTGVKTGDVRTPQPSSAKGEASRVPESPGVKAGDTVRMPQPPGAKGEGSRVPESPGSRAGDTVRMPPPSGAKGEGSRIPDAPGVRAGDVRAPQQPGGIGTRKPDVGNVKIGGTRIPDGIKTGASDLPPSQKGKDNAGLKQPGSDVGQNIKGDKSTFNSGLSADRKSSPGLKDWIISKTLEAADAQAKRYPSKIETGKPGAPQSKSPGLPIDRGLPSVAKAQPETRATTSGARGIDTPQQRNDHPKITPARSVERNPNMIPTIKEGKLGQSPNRVESSRFITIKLDNNLRRSDAPALKDNQAHEPTFTLTVARRLGNGIEVPVSAKAIDAIRHPGSVIAAGWKPALPGSDAMRPVSKGEPPKVADGNRGLGRGVIEAGWKPALPGSDAMRPSAKSEPPKVEGVKREPPKVEDVKREPLKVEDGKLGPTLRGERLTLPVEPATTRTFAKHQPDGQSAKIQPGDASDPVSKLDTARGGTERTESLLPKSRKDQVKAQDQPSDTVPHSIRDVFRKFQLALPKRSFSPEITESGNYVAQPGQSSQRLQAFISSGQHKAIRGDAERSFDSRKFIPLFEDDDDTEKSKDEPGIEPELENKNATDLQFAKTLTPANASRNAAVQHDSVRKMYIVKAGDTPRSIAVAELNDHLLENLIVEINKLVFQNTYDEVQGVNVKVLPVGAMILLPNAHDIATFRERQ